MVNYLSLIAAVFLFSLPCDQTVFTIIHRNSGKPSSELQNSSITNAQIVSTEQGISTNK